MLNMNPFTFLRRRAGLSQNDFCRLYGFAKQTIVGIESGMYPELSDRMIISLGKACATSGVQARLALLENYGVDKLQIAYIEWRTRERLSIAPVINAYRPTEWTLDQSPMEHMVLNTVGSAQGFAKKLKIPSATLMRYSRGGQWGMPVSIESALRQLQYPYLLELVQAQTAWMSARENAKEEEQDNG